MQAKLHKAKLITVHSKIIDPQDKQLHQSPSTAIHAYMTLLKQLIQNNKHHIKNTSDSTNNKIKMSSPSLRRKGSKNWLAPLNAEPTARKKSFRQYCNNRQQILNSIMQKNHSLISVNSLTKLQGKGNKSERIQRTQQKQYKGFIPIGKIYQQLKQKTQQSVQLPSTDKMNSSINLKNQHPSEQNRKRFSIYAKQTRSIQRNVFKEQNRTNNAKMPIQLTTRSAFDQNKLIQRQNSYPQPW